MKIFWPSAANIRAANEDIQVFPSRSVADVAVSLTARPQAYAHPEIRARAGYELEPAVCYALGYGCAFYPQRHSDQPLLRGGYYRRPSAAACAGEGSQWNPGGYSTA